jgi:hypothetical protein
MTAGVLIGLLGLAGCGPTANGAQAPATQSTTAVTTTDQPVRPTTTVTVPPPTTTVTTPRPRTPAPVVAKFVPAKIYAATCEITKPPAPKDIKMSCDSTLFLRQATWSTWNQTHAEGRGEAAVNDCVPDCALGKFEEFPVSVHFDTPVRTTCGTTWENAVVTFIGKPPSGLDYYEHGKGIIRITTTPDRVRC